MLYNSKTKNNNTSSITGNVTGDITSGIAGDITGDATGDITGDICLVCVGGCMPCPNPRTLLL